MKGILQHVVPPSRKSKMKRMDIATSNSLVLPSMQTGATQAVVSCLKFVGVLEAMKNLPPMKKKRVAKSGRVANAFAVKQKAREKRVLSFFVLTTFVTVNFTIFEKFLITKLQSLWIRVSNKINMLKVSCNVLQLELVFWCQIWLPETTANGETLQKERLIVDSET